MRGQIPPRHPKDPNRYQRPLLLLVAMGELFGNRPDLLTMSRCEQWCIIGVRTELFVKVGIFMGVFI